MKVYEGESSTVLSLNAAEAIIDALVNADAAPDFDSPTGLHYATGIKLTAAPPRIAFGS